MIICPRCGNINIKPDSLIKRIAELEAELAKYKPNWQEGPVPETGVYKHEVSPSVCKLVLHVKGQIPNSKWIGPILPLPEEE